MLHLDHADGAFHAHILDAGHAAAGRQTLQQSGSNGGNLLQPRLAFEQIERGIGSGAAERIGHVARSVHQRFLGVVGPEDVEHFLRRDSRRQRQRAAGERLRQRDDVGRYAGRLAGE